MIDLNVLAEAAEECAPVPTNEQLNSIAFLAKKQQRLEREVAEATKVLAGLQKDLARVAELELPEALAAVHMAEFTLQDGYKVSVKDEVYANIPSADTDSVDLYERRLACFQYLRDTNNEALIKHEIIVAAGKGEDAKAQETKRVLEEAGIQFTDSESVHAGTLKAFVREQVLERQTGGFPKETFGFFNKKVASIKAPKKQKN